MRKLFDFAYIMNFMSQAAFSFAFPFFIWLVLGYLLTSKAGLGDWVMIVCIVIGIVNSVYSMFKYIITMADRATGGRIKNNGKSVDKNKNENNKEDRT